MSFSLVLSGILTFIRFAGWVSFAQTATNALKIQRRPCPNLTEPAREGGTLPVFKTSLIFLLLWTLAWPVWAELKTFTVKAQAFIGDNQTKNEARHLATLEAKRQALEQAGTYVESLTLVKNSVLSKDEILAFTGGLSKTEIISEKAITHDQSFGLEIVAKVTVDSALVENRIKHFAVNRETLEKEKALLARNQQLEQEIRAYQAQLKKLKDLSQVQQLRASTGQKLENKYNATDWFRKGYEAYLLKQYDTALGHYNQALKLDPTYAAAYLNRGVVYYERQQYPQALADYTQAIRYDPQLLQAYNNRGVLYKQLKQYDKALADYALALKLNPKYAKTYNNRGTVYSELKLSDKALADYNQALRLDPQFAYAYNNRGNIYSQRKAYTQALSDYSKALSLLPNYAQALSSRGAVYLELQQYPQALADLNQALKLSPNSAAAYNHRGTVYQALGQPEKALADWRKACALGLGSTCEWLKQVGK